MTPLGTAFPEDVEIGRIFFFGGIFGYISIQEVDTVNSG